jgi:hypothetical protein
MSDIFAAVEQLLSILKARSQERAFFMRYLGGSFPRP